jgi:hypothetical protein
VLETGRIVGARRPLREGTLAKLSDPGAIREHLGRISRAIEFDDPARRGRVVKTRYSPGICRMARLSV